MNQQKQNPPSAPLYLRQWREHRGFSQEQVAQLMSDFLGREVARDRVSRLENGVNWPREDIMAAFAYALGVEVTMLFAAPTADTARRQKLALLERLASDSDLDAFLALVGSRKSP